MLVLPLYWPLHWVLLFSLALVFPQGPRITRHTIRATPLPFLVISFEMLRALLLSTIITGFLSGLVLTLVQRFEVIPILLKAESYETIGREKSRADKEALEHTEHSQTHLAWAPEDGVERFLWTAFANISLGIGFALLLCAIYAWRYRESNKREIRLREGMFWGIGGLVVFFINPALGMLPEIPGNDAVAVEIRQGWWILTVICTAIGLGLIVFQRQTIGALTGAVFCLLPHVIGAPHAETSDRVPSELKEAFLGATYLANAIFWVVLGLISAWVFRRFTQRLGT